jgi:hypothetical protein
MAQTNFTPISLYYSTTASAAPTAGNLVAGELAINTADGKLFYKDSAGVVQTIASKAGNSGSFTNLAYTGTLTGGTGIVNLGSGQFYKDASGNVIVGGTSTSSDEATYQSGGVFVSRRASSAGTTHANFLNGGSSVGSITSTTVATFYNTTSDYRLKENATPVTTGLQTITALNPVNFDWISKNVSDTGFLAHEFQAVIPNSVMGTKDAIDENGNPIYQQIDRGGAIPFLVAAIKELNAKVDAQAARIAALEA